MFQPLEDLDLPLQVVDIVRRRRGSLENFARDLFERFRVERETNDAECS